MNLQQLHYFRVLAKVQHYTKASEILLISQPSLSYSISQLEKELNVELFNIVGKKVVLSKYGEFFLPYVETALDTLDEGKKKLEIFVDPSIGKVNIGFIYSISSNFIPRLVNEFYKDTKNKSIKINFIQNLNVPLLKDLVANKVDLVFCATPNKDVNYKQIYKQRLYLLVPKDHPLSSKDKVYLSELSNEKFILLNKNSSLRNTCDEIFEEHNIKPNIVFEAEECNAAVSFVALNFGISIIPEMPIMNDKVKKIDLISFKDIVFERSIYMCWNKGEILNPSVEKIKALVLEKFPYYEINLIDD